MSIFQDRRQFEDIMGALFDRVLKEKEIVQELEEANLIVRFFYTDPESVLTVDLTSRPPSYRFDDEGNADVEMTQSAEVAHEFWLGRLSAVRGLATGKISARGNVPKALRLLPAIKPVFNIYPDVLRQLDLHYLIPPGVGTTSRRKGDSWWGRLFRSRASVDLSRLPQDTMPGQAEEPTIRTLGQSPTLPENEAELRKEMLRRMILIREFEQSLAENWRAGKIPTTALHLSIGQEAVAVGSCFALDPSDCIATTHRGHGHMLAKGAPADRMMAEIYGKSEGLCGGKGGSMHVTDITVGAIGANGIVGASSLIGTGAALAFAQRQERRVAVTFMGDGATNQGMFHEAINLAAVWSLPVLFVVENNQYGEFTPQNKHMRIERIADRAAAYGISGVTVDGNDADQVYQAAKKAVNDIREGKGPILLECLTYRWRGHMEGDAEAYRTREEVESWKSRCPIKRMGERLIAEGLITKKDYEQMQMEAGDTVEQALHFALGSPEPDPSTLRTDVFTNDTPLPPNPPPGKTRSISGSAAINLALAEEMRRDNSVVLLGEDVSLGGYMAVTTGLAEEFGLDKVRDTPISEYAIVGTAVGAAMSGLRPVAEILFSDFVTCCMDPLVNQAAKLRYMSGGQYRLPLVVRLPSGAGLGMAAQHSQSLESLLMGIPGLHIAAPSSPRDARALLKTAIRSDNPVLFYEHKLIYLTPGGVPEAEECLPFGQAEIKRIGSDLTVVGLLYTVTLALEAAELLKAEGIDLEVVDPRTLVPLDMETILRSVAKTGRLMTIEEGPVRGGWGAEVVARVASAAHGLLKAPPVRLGGSDNPIPYNKNLENLSVPNVERIAEAIREMFT
jgi:2-oxoisovalerate dehydrogenase E1 component